METSIMLTDQFARCALMGLHFVSVWCLMISLHTYFIRCKNVKLTLNNYRCTFIRVYYNGHRAIWGAIDYYIFDFPIARLDIALGPL